MQLLLLQLCLVIYRLRVQAEEEILFNITEIYNVTDIEHSSDSVGNDTWSTELEGSGEPMPCPLVEHLSVRERREQDRTISILSWTPPEESSTTSVCVTLNSTDISCTTNESCDLLPESHERTLPELCPYHDYNIVAHFVCGAVHGMTNVLEYRSKPGKPGPPTIAKFSFYWNETTMKICWKKPKILNGPLDGYVISFGRNYNDAIEFRRPSNTTCWKEFNLNPGTNYVVGIAAFNEFDNKTLTGLSATRTFTTNETEPGPPREVVVLVVTNSSFHVSWLEPEKPNGNISRYVVYWKYASGRISEATTTDTYIVLKDSPSIGHRVLPFTRYTVSVRAVNGYGLGLESEHVNFTTKVGVPGKARNLTAIQQPEILQIKLSWVEPTVKGCSPLSYEVSLWKHDDGEEFRLAVHTQRSTSYDLSQGINPWTNYTVRIRSVCTSGFIDLYGNASQTTFQTGTAVPQGLVDVRTYVAGSRNITLKWKNPDPYPGPGWFTVDVWKHNPCGENEVSFKKVVYGDLNFTTVSGLQPAATYTFKLRASTASGDGPEWISEPITMDPDMPSKPLNFYVNCSLGPNHVALQWYEPLERNGILNYYLAEYIENGVEDVKRGRKVYVVSDNERDNVCEPPTLKQMQMYRLLPELLYNFSIRASAVNVTDFGPAAHFACTLPVGVPLLPFTRPEMNHISQMEASFQLNKRTFSEERGTILYYSVIVTLSLGPDEPLTGSMDKYLDLPTWFSYWKKESKLFQSTPPEWNPFKNTELAHDPLNCVSINGSVTVLHCIVGQEKNCSEGPSRYCNGPLMPNTRYGLKIRGFTKAGFAETYTAVFVTQGVPQKSYAGVVTAVVCSFLVVVSIAFVVLWKKKKVTLSSDFFVLFRKTNPPDEPTVTISTLSKAVPVEIRQQRPLSFPSFLEHFKKMMSDSALKFSLEFEELKDNSPRHPTFAAEMEENRPKNRWTNILPFDHSRVKLLPIDDEPGSDYINASYIPGFFSHREYIASQGPLPSTVDDFWRMIWEQKVSVIVMLTQCVERGKVKCEQYWPKLQGADVYYGDLRVEMTSEVVLCSFTIRSFMLSLGSRQYSVKQMHYTHWPDFGCPETPGELIHFVQSVKGNVPMNPGPILVHCSAGVGRTGTFIAVERLLQHIECNSTLDIYQTVMEMRDHRLNMVQTEDQYIYIHKCLKELILKKVTTETRNIETSANNLHNAA